jgi:cytochrome c556
MAATVKGEVPWDDARMAGWGKDLKALSGLNAMRGFPAGSEGGHAKPEIWSNLADFQKKLEAMQLEIAKMGDAAMGGDRAAIGEQVAATGKACKACHDDYKKKDE